MDHATRSARASCLVANIGMLEWLVAGKQVGWVGDPVRQLVEIKREIEELGEIGPRLKKRIERLRPELMEWRKAHAKTE